MSVSFTGIPKHDPSSFVGHRWRRSLLFQAAPALASAGWVGLQAYAEACRRALQGFLAGEGSITPSAFLDALMAAMTCGTIFDRASYSYASKAIGSLSKISNHSRGSLPRQSSSWWGNFCSGSVPKPRQIRRRDYPVLIGSQ